MKKLFAIIVALVCLFSLGTAALAEGEEMVPVCISVPEGWEAPCLWAWADDGTNAFAAWPGEEADPLGDTGWYYCYVPSFVQNIIVNANAGAVQTDGVVVEAGKAAWITVADDNTATVSYDAEVEADIPEYVEKITVHAYVPLEWKTVNLWAWLDPDGTNAFDAWPGKAMTENENGWFTARVPNWVNSIIVSGNEGAVQTEDVTIEPKELWITVYDDLSYELAYEDPETAGVENITVYAQVPADWEGPCLWAWSAPDGTNAFANWPGEAMTESDGWYALEAPGWINSVIINANEGSVQTTDLSVETGKDVWVVVTDAENAAVSYEQPAGDAAEAESPAPEASPAATEAPAETGSGSSATIWIVVAVVVVAVVVVAVVVSKKKKKD